MRRTFATLVRLALGTLALLASAATASAGEAPPERDVTYRAGGLAVVGTLAAPAGPGPVPIVLMLHGMGGARDGSRVRGSDLRLFAELAAQFARRGVASLRISTGGRGGSEGAFVDLTLARRLDEALAAAA